MAYYNHGQYQYGQQPPPPPPAVPPRADQPAGYYNQNGQYVYSQQQQPAYQQNNVQDQLHHSGPAVIDQYEGVVQQPQGGYPGQHTYQYNPQDYAAATQPPAPQQYNPQNYASSNFSSPSQAQYSPSSWQQAQSAATGGPIDSYGYSPAAYSTSSFASQHSTHVQPPQSQHYSPQSDGHPYNWPHHQVPPPQQAGGSYQQQFNVPPPNLPLQDPPTNYRPPPSPTPPSNQAYAAATAHWPPPQGTGLAQPDYRTPQVSGTELEQWRPSPVSHEEDWRRPLQVSSISTGYAEGPTPPAHTSANTSTLERHPTGRGLPTLPGRSNGRSYVNRQSDHSSESTPHEEEQYDDGSEDEEHRAQEELFQQVEAAFNNAGRSEPHNHRPSISLSRPPYPETNDPHLFGSVSRRAGLNWNVANDLHPAPLDSSAHSSDSDAEAAHGLAMMRMDEETAAYGTSVGSSTLGHRGHSRADSTAARYRSQSNVTSGSHGLGTSNSTRVRGTEYGHYPSNSTGDLRTPQSNHPSRDYGSGSSRHLPHYPPAARVDAGGVGGLSEPLADGRRRSYDEGDEFTFNETQQPDRYPDEPPDVFHHVASVSHRPLPAPPGGMYDAPPDAGYRPQQHLSDPRAFLNQQDQWVSRSSSLANHVKAPAIQHPLRAKTDAEERKRYSQIRSAYNTYDSATGTLPAALDLPSLPGKRFVPSQLGTAAFNKCHEPWSLKCILNWLLQIVNPDQVSELKACDVREALVALFTNKVPTMNIADAECLGDRVMQDMHDAGTLVATEEWVKIVPGPMSGVIFQLTGAGCYAPTVHGENIEVPAEWRCYSHRCQRTLKKVNLQKQDSCWSEDWAEYWHLSKDQTESRGGREATRQNMLHEIVTTEEKYTQQLALLQTLYRDALIKSEPSVISPKRQDRFVKEVFGRVDAVKQANEEHLLPQLKYRQHEQGPWILGFSDIFRQWVRKAKPAYVEYAGSFPSASFLVRQEDARNYDFHNFLQRAQSDKRSKKLDWSSYLKAPITRLQRYGLQLSSMLSKMEDGSEEKENLKLAVDEVKAVTMECDTRVAEMQRKVDLSDLSAKLVLRPQMKSYVQLNLDHFGRKLVYRGDLQRMGGNRFTWLECHGLLFDHYLVLAKIVSRDEHGARQEKYDVSRLPIPMDLLLLESTNDPAVQKRDYMRGITSVREASGRTTQDTPLPSRPTASSSPGPGGLAHVNTASSNATIHSVTTMSSREDQDKIMYPFKVKHLGRETYTLFAPSENARRDWCRKMIDAKTKHAAALHNQNAEPFKLRVMADSAFVYDAFAHAGGRSVVIKGTPVDRAIKEVEQRFQGSGRPGPICRARVNCAAGFTTAASEGGKQMVAVGTDYGIFISEADNPRGWMKVISMTRVTQVAVLEDFNVFLVIADKVLIAYHLDAVCPQQSTANATAGRPSVDSARRAPQKLSGSRDVGFFAMGRMKDRTLVIYKKRENMASVFKVLEPIYQRSSEKRRNNAFTLRRGTTEFFREFDEFYIPTECNDINLFHSSLAVSTARGFEVLTLDKKQPWSVPDLKASHVQNIATTIKDQKALSMLRLSDQEFLLVYAHCAVYVNKHGDVSRSVILNFVATAQAAALHGAYLILFDADFVEIRNAQNGRLKQIIPGREVKCLDDGGCSTGVDSAGSPPRTVKLVMQHPEAEKTQVVIELLLNDNLRET